MLLHGGPAAIARRSHRGHGLVLAYHNIVPDGEAIGGDASLHLRRRDFARQLDLLLDSGIRIVTLDELLGQERKDTESVRRVAITFDDAYLGAVEAGVAELVHRRLPATFFVVPGLVGGRTFWWDALAATGGLSDDTRVAALEEASGRSDEVVAWAQTHGIPIGTVPEHARTATESHLHAAVAHPGIELASHTWSHPNLARLTETECKHEFESADAWLLERFSVEPRWASYPYGMHGVPAERAAASAGYRGVFRIDGGWLAPQSEQRLRYRLPRLNVPAGISSEGFALRLSGLLGAI